MAGGGGGGGGGERERERQRRKEKGVLQAFSFFLFSWAAAGNDSVPQWTRFSPTFPWIQSRLQLRPTGYCAFHTERDFRPHLLSIQIQSVTIRSTGNWLQSLQLVCLSSCLSVHMPASQSVCPAACLHICPSDAVMIHSTSFCSRALFQLQETCPEQPSALICALATPALTWPDLHNWVGATHQVTNPSTSIITRSVKTIPGRPPPKLPRETAMMHRHHLTFTKGRDFALCRRINVIIN